MLTAPNHQIYVNNVKIVMPSGSLAPEGLETWFDSDPWENEVIPVQILQVHEKELP